MNSNQPPSAPAHATASTQAQRPIPPRPPKTNPLVFRKKGVRVPQKPPPPPPNAKPPAAAPAPTKKSVHADDEPEPQGPYRDIPIVLTKRELLKGFRYHAMKLQSDRQINLTNPEKWPQPIKLHRRDPRSMPSASSSQEPLPEEPATQLTPEEIKEKEKIEAIKAERKRVREENQAQIAPSAKQQQQANRQPKFAKPFEQVFMASDTPEGKTRAQIKYEESLPWHLEGEGGNNVWKGTYVAELSNRNAMLVFENSNNTPRVRLVMLEKWYRFMERAKFQMMSFEEAEAMMSRDHKDPQFLVNAEKRQIEESERQKPTQPRVIKVKGSGDGGKFGDIDDMDFNETEQFDNDDEGNIYGADSDPEVQEASERIRKGQYQMNAFGENEEGEEDDPSNDSLKKLEKNTRKALVKKEMNANYNLSDDESDPYASSSEEESGYDTAAAEKETSGESQTTQPSSQSQSTQAPPRVSNSKLKRPVSPVAGEGSDADASRKRAKKNPKKGKAAAATADGAKPSTPVSSGPSAAAGKPKKGKAAAARAPPTPQQAKAPGSPARPSASKAESDDEDDFFTESPVIVTLDKIRSAIPTDGRGISLRRLLNRFREMDKSTPEFVVMLKQAAHFDKKKCRVYPIDSLPPKK